MPALPLPSPSFLQFNCNKLQYSRAELLDFLHFIAHHDAWHSRTDNGARTARGDDPLSLLFPPSFHLCNTNIPTTLPTRRHLTSLDLTFISAHLALATRKVSLTSLNSDHLPIVISTKSASSVLPCRSHTFTNYKKANWEYFHRETEEGFGASPFPPLYSGSKHTLRQINANAAKHHIRTGWFRMHSVTSL